MAITRSKTAVLAHSHSVHSTHSRTGASDLVRRSSTVRRSQTNSPVPPSGQRVDDEASPSRPAPSYPQDKTVSKRKRKRDEPVKEQPEKRAKAFRKKPPKAYIERLERALTQRLCILKRERTDTDVEPAERFTLCGSTGNVYVVVIRKVPSCTCPDARKGNQCKHVIYVLHNVLKAPEHLQYQSAFLSSEIQGIFDNSPPTPSENASLENKDGHRKPIEGECPICFMPLEPERSDILWCKAGCGNNVHRSCFKQWAATATAEGKEVRCVYCRTPWAPDIGDISSLLTNATLGNEGYLNVAEALNLSNNRGTTGTSSSSIRGSLATLFVTSWTHEIIQRIISHGCADDYIVTSNSPRAPGLLVSEQPILVNGITIHWDGETIQKIDFHCRG